MISRYHKIIFKLALISYNTGTIRSTGSAGTATAGTDTSPTVNPAGGGKTTTASKPVLDPNTATESSPPQGSTNGTDTGPGGNGAQASISCEANLLVLSLLACAAAKNFNAYISLF